MLYGRKCRGCLNIHRACPGRCFCCWEISHGARGGPAKPDRGCPQTPWEANAPFRQNRVYPSWPSTAVQVHPKSQPSCQTPTLAKPRSLPTAWMNAWPVGCCSMTCGSRDVRVFGYRSNSQASSGAGDRPPRHNHIRARDSRDFHPSPRLLAGAPERL